MKRFVCCICFFLLLCLQAFSSDEKFADVSTLAHDGLNNEAQPFSIGEVSGMDSPAEFAQRVINAVDGKDPETFTSFMTEQCTFVFGNAAPVVGRQNIANYLPVLCVDTCLLYTSPSPRD
eukprot:TRINITY_DN3306_c0_g1_i1.p1 TRINITY_DN3306_c0_g1~~TRINITY_DN3306_c0_g1_i1.p1  ORF type:complete len:120 (+),score=13.53 TRINITY_DN3306_c0_g1_i1:238-597(+)